MMEGENNNSDEANQQASNRGNIWAVGVSVGRDAAAGIRHQAGSETLKWKLDE